MCREVTQAKVTEPGLVNVPLLWFNFILGLNFFPLFQTNYHTWPYPETKKKIQTKDIIETQQLSGDLDLSTINSSMISFYFILFKGF